MIQLN